MKSTMTFLVLLIGVTAYTQKTKTYEDKKGAVHLIGFSQKADLNQEPYKKWYTETYDEYEIDNNLIKATKKKAKDISVKVFMGTWCGDSKREVPRFYKIAEQLGINETDITLINLSAEEGEYKQCPTGEEEGYNIHRVPTFIFYNENEEIGRIVESPVTSLEMDMAQMFNGLPTAPRYTAVTYMNELFNTESIDTINAHIKDHYKRTFYMVKGNTSELNTYGYVLLDQEEYDKAIVVFKINSMIFKDKAGAFDSLAEAYMRSGDKEKAIEHYKTAMAKDVHKKYTPDILVKLMTEL